MKGKISVLVTALLLLWGCKSDDPVDLPVPAPDAYSFMVAGHGYGNPGASDTVLGLYPPFVSKFDYINQYPGMEFGILTGDLVKYSNQERWDSVMTHLGKLDFPTYIAPGNHENWGFPYYQAFLNAPYTYFEKANDLIIILDPDDDTWRIPQEQIRFVEILTERAEAYSNIFVFFHQVLWYDPEPGGVHSRIVPNNITARADTINFWSELDAIFASVSNPVYYFSGDVGAWCTGREAGIYTDGNRNYIYSGMGCDWRSTCLIVKVDPEKQVTFDLLWVDYNDMDTLGTLEDYRYY